jgi:hypothetical protein
LASGFWTDIGGSFEEALLEVNYFAFGEFSP